MASRKSCTHMTWAEAKAKSSDSVVNKKNKEAGRIKAETHGKLLAAKVLAKAAPSASEQIQNRQAARLARRDEERRKHLQAQREAEKERQRQQALMAGKPHEQALDRLNILAQDFCGKPRKDVGDTVSAANDDDLDIVCESKQMQMDEIMALEAMYIDNPDTIMIAQDSEWDEFQCKMNQWLESPEDKGLQQSIVSHPSIRVVWKRSIDDPKDGDWVAHCLWSIAFPSSYPMQTTPPTMKVEWFLLTQKSLTVAANKPLESLGTLDESKLMEDMIAEAQENLIGMPCLYELMDSWLGEHLFDYIAINPVIG